MQPRQTDFFDDDLHGMPVRALAFDYPDGHEVDRHEHPHAQLIHAVSGVMVVATEAGHWIVPPSRGVWVPCGVPHGIRMVGQVHMRTAFVRPEAVPGLPEQCQVVSISPLLRELVLSAIEIPMPYTLDARNGRVMRLLLDELCVLPVLPMQLPQPRDTRLRRICEGLIAEQDDVRTVDDWADALGISGKTVQRLFQRETGMSFGAWRQQARLLHALERLAAGSRVVDVAFDLGYGSPSAFSTMFRRQFGIAPRDFFR